MTLTTLLLIASLNTFAHADYSSAVGQVESEERAQQQARDIAAAAGHADDFAIANATFARCHGGYASGPTQTDERSAEFTTNDGWSCEATSSYAGHLACANPTLVKRFVLMTWPTDFSYVVSSGDAQPASRCFVGHSSRHRSKKARR